MAIYYMGELISGQPKTTQQHTRLRNIGDRVIFAIGQFTDSQAEKLTVNLASA